MRQLPKPRRRRRPHPVSHSRVGSRSRPMTRRMLVAVLALGGVFLAAYLTLYHYGYVGSLACGTGGCEKVQGSSWANFLGVPVALWGTGYYMSVFAVATAGSLGPWVERRWPSGALVFLNGWGCFLGVSHLGRSRAHPRDLPILRRECRAGGRPVQPQPTGPAGLSAGPAVDRDRRDRRGRRGRRLSRRSIGSGVSRPSRRTAS